MGKWINLSSCFIIHFLLFLSGHSPGFFLRTETSQLDSQKFQVFRSEKIFKGKN